MYGFQSNLRSPWGSSQVYRIIWSGLRTVTWPLFLQIVWWTSLLSSFQYQWQISLSSWSPELSFDENKQTKKETTKWKNLDSQCGERKQVSYNMGRVMRKGPGRHDTWFRVICIWNLRQDGGSLMVRTFKERFLRFQLLFPDFYHFHHVIWGMKWAKKLKTKNGQNMLSGPFSHDAAHIFKRVIQLLGLSYWMHFLRVEAQL